MFCALLEIENLPAMREIREQINHYHALIQSTVGNPTEFENNKAILKVLMDKRMKMLKTYYSHYEKTHSISGCKELIL